ncbi:MAG: DUF1850 domain-containing protein [Rubrivivax sp.]
MTTAAAVWAACELLLLDPRSGTELQRLTLPAPELVLAFEHSVLGTTVEDRYVFTPRAQLVEERFDGQGYGLPHAAGPGETLERDGTGWRLRTRREVHPLVVRALPAQALRVRLPGAELPLAAWSARGIELRLQGCR